MNKMVKLTNDINFLQKNSKKKDNLYFYFFRYLKYEIRRQIFTSTAKALDKIMGNSSLIMPYQTHRDNPRTKKRIMRTDKSSTSLFFKTLMSCGNIATEVIPPATRPKIFSSIF